MLLAPTPPFNVDNGATALETVISGLGLTAPNLIVDVGDNRSFNGGRYLYNIMDTAYRWDFGEQSDPTAPTFHGNYNGKSENDYVEFDGSDDYVTANFTTNANWMRDFHKTSMSFVAVVRKGSSTNNASVLGNYNDTNGPSASFDLGWSGTSGNGIVWCYDNDGNYHGRWIGVLSQSTFYIIGLSVVLSSGGAIKVNINGTGSTFAMPTGTWGSMSNNAMNKFGIMCDGDDRFPDPQIGTRFFSLMVWQGTALTATNLSDIYNGIKGRYGL